MSKRHFNKSVVLNGFLHDSSEARHSDVLRLVGLQILVRVSGRLFRVRLPTGIRGNWSRLADRGVKLAQISSQSVWLGNFASQRFTAAVHRRQRFVHVLGSRIIEISHVRTSGAIAAVHVGARVLLASNVKGVLDTLSLTSASAGWHAVG